MGRTLRRIAFVLFAAVILAGADLTPEYPEAPEHDDPQARAMLKQLARRYAALDRYSESFETRILFTLDTPDAVGVERGTVVFLRSGEIASKLESEMPEPFMSTHGSIVGRAGSYVCVIDSEQKFRRLDMARTALNWSWSPVAFLLTSEETAFSEGIAEMRPDETVQGQDCFVIRHFGGWQGSYSEYWIDKDTGLLLKLFSHCGCTYTDQVSEVRPRLDFVASDKDFVVDTKGYEEVRRRARSKR